jgi:hypothetical protein
MNRRIKELAEQATDNILGVKILDDAKFAEFIIKECVNVVEGGSFLHDQAPTAIFAKECSAAIKRHFGVKE